MRPVFSKDSSTTLNDMMNCTLDFALKVNEYLDIKESLEEEYEKEAQSKVENSRMGGR